MGAKWKATAFCCDREEGYSVSWPADSVRVEHHADGTVTVELDAPERRAYFVVDAALLAAGGVKLRAPAPEPTPARTKPAPRPAVQEDMDFG